MKRKYVVYGVIIVLLVAVLALALAYSLGSDRDTAAVVLPDTAPSSDDASESSEQTSSSVIDVTPENVQVVIETLSRSESYFSQITETVYSSGGTRESLISLWVQDGQSRSVITSDTETKNILTQDNEFWIWYSDDTSKVYHSTTDAEPERIGEELGGVPDYTAVLDLPKSAITSAEYDSSSGVPCIRVECALSSTVTAEYRVSVDTGLLVGCERYENGELVYSLTADVTTPANPGSDVFKLG